VLDKSLTGIRAEYDPRTILFEPLDARADLEPLRRVAGVQEISRTNGAYEISLTEGLEPSMALGQIATAVPAARVELNRPSLEDVFIQLVSGGKSTRADEVVRLRAALRDDTAVGVDE
jgi:ABC-type uncharacterized transport system ATPase subunit